MWSGQEIDAAIIAHAPLVRRLAWSALRRMPANVEHDDLVQAGMIGLLDAATRFDPAKGIAFEGFAVSRISGAFLDELREMDWMPRTVRRAQRSIEAAIREVEQQVGRAARESEVADEMRMTLPAYQRMLGDAQTPVVLNLSSGTYNDGEDGLELVDVLPDPDPGPDERFAEKRLHAAIAKQLRTLSARHKLVMRLLYDDDRTQLEVAARFGVTESRVCQIHAEIVVALRKGLREHGAPPVPRKPTARQKRLALAEKRMAAKKGGPGISPIRANRRQRAAGG